MKVLLLGEFSGFYTNLKDGLRELGATVTLAANGDGWKKIEGADMPLYKTGEMSAPGRVFHKLIMPVMQKGRWRDYDVVQLVHGCVFRPYINSIMIRALKRQNGKLFENICGNCYTLYQSWRNGKLGYYTLDDNPDKCEMYTGSGLRQYMTRATEEYVDSVADGIIPIMYEYAVGVRERENCLPTIQLPFNAEKVPFSENKVGNKLVFYHGINKPKDKGTAYIKEAFEIIQSRYPNDVQMIVKGGMPLNEYLEVLRSTNILVDQCKEHCWGLNACYGMAQGKVIMGGASRNSLKEFGLQESPVIHIKPDVHQIVQQIEYVIENRAKVSVWGEESRHFVETFHDHRMVAQRYLDAWARSARSEDNL